MLLTLNDLMHARLLYILTELFGDLPDSSILQDYPIPALLLPVLPQLKVVELVQAEVGQAHGLPAGGGVAAGGGR